VKYPKGKGYMSFRRKTKIKRGRYFACPALRESPPEIVIIPGG
jgi:hypothetical protein